MGSILCAARGGPALLDIPERRGDERADRAAPNKEERDRQDSDHGEPEKEQVHKILLEDLAPEHEEPPREPFGRLFVELPINRVEVARAPLDHLYVILDGRENERDHARPPEN